MFIFSILITSYGVNEYIQNKKQLFELMDDQAAIVLQTVTISANNTLLATLQMEELLKERLLNNAEFIKHLYQEGVINNDVLREFAEKNNLFRINIFNNSGERIYSNRQPKGRGLRRNSNHQQIGAGGHPHLQPIFSGECDTVIMGLRESRYGLNLNYAIALGTSDGGAIMINIDAEQLRGLKDNVGFALLAKSIVIKPLIKYFAFQDSLEIIASEDYKFESIESSDFLKKAIKSREHISRITKYKSEDVYEVVQPYYFNGELYGLIRLGFDLTPMDERLSRSVMRIIISLALTIAIGFVLLFMTFLKRDLDSLRKQYKAVETFSSQIIENVSDAVLVYDEKKIIRTANKSFLKLFGFIENISGKQLEDVLGGLLEQLITSGDDTIGRFNFKISDRMYYLLGTKSSFFDENNQRNTIIFIKDITEITHLGEQIERSERLTAIGHLASGVAHEIRNPLNTISTVIQQIRMDLINPIHGSSVDSANSDLDKLTDLVYKEVNRIKDSISNFLKFAKPQKPNPSTFILNSFLDEITLQFETVLGNRNIQLSVINQYNEEVFWDRNQLKQVFINLIQNAMDSIIEKVTKNETKDSFELKNNYVKIIVSEKQDRIELIIKDSGVGIEDELVSKIFNLYFTTKVKGTGIGLSIVQKIIDEHKGIISVNSMKETGTEFIINLPKRI